MQSAHKLFNFNLAFTKVEHLSANFVVSNGTINNIVIVNVDFRISVPVGKDELGPFTRIVVKSFHLKLTIIQ